MDRLKISTARFEHKSDDIFLKPACVDKNGLVASVILKPEDLICTGKFWDRKTNRNKKWRGKTTSEK